MDDFLQKLMLFRLAFGQSYCKKASLYQLPCNNHNKLIQNWNCSKIVRKMCINIISIEKFSVKNLAHSSTCGFSITRLNLSASCGGKGLGWGGGSESMDGQDVPFCS